ncbi:Histidine kinase-like ATPase domain-containing protein [Nocardioides alpinus]|uniref:ATP-binding protein n=1 Tax=Nocardioides alpinus TaxID=748909 RepID=A0A1I1BEA8_9ACTN|nr:ATP-binding protein [Nocardioides alpinus]PKH39389.1 ATP-binding protein [Nocardioides alpinus]SFB48709.1 Histidine kinase-like ATPase domain-containing protein [Nocardioides alpinus]
MGGASAKLHIRLAADAASVSGARRFVVDGLSAWGQARFADAAELVTSELTTNAALHAGADFMYVTLERRTTGVRVYVEDDGPLGPDMVQARTPATGDRSGSSELDATGRGLAIVGMVAGRWGVDETARGKQVWAELVDPEDAGHLFEEPQRLRPSRAPEAVDELPPGWVLVRLAQCPVELSLQQDRHLDELVRELQLLSVDQGSDQSLALADEIRGLLVSPTHARLTGRRAAERAREEGKDVMDVDMAMPREFSELIVHLHEAVARADQLCAEGHLLTLASPPDVQELRAWMTQEIVGQATRGTRPVPWADWQRTSSVPMDTP